MILMSELSKRRFRSVNKLIRVGRHEVVLVLRVDSQKGYIDLSKRRVSPKDIIKCEEKFSKSKKVHQTVRHVAKEHGITVEELNEKAIWPLYERYGHALDALKEATMNPENVFKGLDISEEIKNSLLKDIKLRLTPQALKLRGRIDVWCFGYEGIDAVKEALKKGKEISNDKVSINIKLIAPPQYVIVTSCHDKDLGMAKIQEAMKVISDKIKEYKGGDFKQQGEILVIGGDEEKRLEELLDKHDGISSDDDDYNTIYPYIDYYNKMTEMRVKADLGDCRFYKKKFPEVDDLIMVKVNRIEDMGAYVSILEYNDMEGNKF
ncbi:hypothetical protein PFMC_01840 [Plasmodium falciparum CAMP/Malaysia]|uniref:S1 motif domain-containing protein n=1 Tax=Plasmodium falciparum (isolate Camp / Malaysia) TaxID=5835 RepID=A0A024XAQ1_PLAFC|nr:hypothetical protein PFMC_01840 [Plasmodium falciparum CAMP/Malaysia]